MTTKPTTAYSPRLPRATSAFWRIRVEAPLAEKLQAAQRRPELAIKDGLKPSTSVLIRRAIQRYTADLSAMDADALKDEVLALHRLI
ncbi:hypothetical protein [Ralstonia solanacearum]|uniref:hypothetical protein n=1 Tax=Ralstonia solanacearum TaxID=305 RepID=UPI00168A7E03|nr:hypothetical protein [Ralstonia solanacearum]QNT25572.1 hypothetical protein C2I38_26300 [Ralstonia solanacearum]QNT25859.1 hypothetical protein C2I38_027705 [Ralstonia solanacearum]QNT63213.1 hypothetical protein C2L97_26290 [Ralstonia solanacearum]